MGLRLLNRPGTTPGIGPPKALISELGPVKPVSGTWQVKQA
jgi:hypothetical protein